MTQTSKGNAVARLLFLVFAYVADCNKRIESQDIEQLHQLLVDLNWAKNAYLRAGLESLRDNYDSFWADYEGGKLVVSLEAARLRMAVAMLDVKAEHADSFKHSLQEFTRRALPVGPGALSVLGLAGSVDRRKARKDVDELLHTGPEPMQIVAAAALAREEAAGGGAEREKSSPAAPDEVALPLAPAVRTSEAASAAVAGWPQSPIAEWTGGRLRAVCVRVTEETHDVKTYTFVSDPPQRFRYRPGQFVTIELPVDGGNCRRSYTLSSSPSRPDTLSITVKRVPGGIASNWLYEQARPGMSFRIDGPFGRFSCLEHPSPKLLLLSGGSGVTPVMSMLRWLADTAAAVDVVFVNNVRSPADVIFGQELACLGVQLGSALNVVVVPSAHAPSRPWNGPMGRLDRNMLLALAPDFMERETFVCGPGPYMDAACSMMSELGYPTTRFHRESFGPAPAATPSPAPKLARETPTLASVRASAAMPAPPRLDAVEPTPAARAALAAVPAAQATVTRPQVRFEHMNVTIGCEDGETLLEAAERSHIALESACRSGRCGTCRLKKISGELAMDSQEALSESDIESGFILACVARPRGLVVVQA